MTWLIKWDGKEVSSDDFTLDELGQVEKEADTSWSIANPLRTALVARAFLRIAIKKLDGDPKDADGLTLGKIKRAFVYRDDDEAREMEDNEEEPDPLSENSPASLHGVSGVSNGRQRKRAVNG